MKFRLLKTGFRDAAENMAIDEAVLEQIADAKSQPALRFYGWSPPAISIGYFQSLEEEVDLAACKKFGVDVVRRMTGGGAVFHEHEITYSIHIPENSKLTPAGILESYESICAGILNGLETLGIKAQFVPLNDLIVLQNGAPKKVSGNAQTRKRGVILQHGTILLKVDVDKMFALLKVPDEKLKGKLIETVKQRVAGLSAAAGREITFDAALEALANGFKKAFPNVDFEAGELTADEKSLAQKLKKEKYKTADWNNQR